MFNENYKLENIMLENKKYLSRVYGKYLPNITIITDSIVEKYENLPVDKELSQYFKRFAEGGIIARVGQYRKNRKNTNIFDFTKKGHILIELFWGSRTNPELKIPNLLPVYYRKASSNSGRSGVTYYVLEENFKIEGNLTEDDF